jgi:hypothetical protein
MNTFQDMHEKDNNLNVLVTTTTMKKIIKDFVNQMVLLFQRFQANAKEIQCPLL